MSRRSKRLATPDPDPRTFLQVVTALPATLGIWRARSEALPALMRAAALGRYLDEQGPIRKDRPDGRDIAAWVRRWQSTTSKLISWCYSFASEGHGLVRQQDIDAALRLAVRWPALEGALEGVARGEWGFTSNGFDIRLQLRRDWSIEALDFYLESVTSPAGPPPAEPRRAFEWFIEQSGIRPTPNPPDWVQHALVRYARKSAERYPGRLPSDFDLGSGLSLGDARACYIGLLGWCALADCHVQFLGISEATLLGVPTPKLIEILEKVTDGSVARAGVEAFIDLMRFRPGRHTDASHAPLIPYGDRLLLPPALLSPRGIERTLLRSAAADPNRFGPVGKALGRQADAWADLLAALPGILVARRLAVVRPDGSAAGDLDIVAIDPGGGVGVVIEAKWPIDALTVREGSKIDDWITSARAQVLRVRRGLEQGLLRTRLPPGWPDFSSVRWHWLVGTPQQLDSRLGQPDADIVPATSLRLAAALPPAPSLAEFLGHLLRPPLPRPGEDYDVVQHEFRVNRYRVVADALVFKRPDWLVELTGHNSNVAA